MTELLATLQRALGDSLTIDRELSGGAMSRVFVAHDRVLGRDIVVKVLPPELAAQVSAERFAREIAVAARLQHAHIVQLLTAGEALGIRYFTMPFVAGESLRARLVRDGELPLADAVRILREVASALAYAHAHHVVHRDIKPDNVLLSGGAAMVTDFGVAKAIDLASDRSQGVHSALTSVGIALGTPAYMAPEQIAADANADYRVDLYAWGVMAYELLAGTLPFSARPVQAMLAAHVAEAPADLHALRPRLPVALTNLVMRCLAKRPDDRPRDAAQIVSALDDISFSGGRSLASTVRGSTAVRRSLAGASALTILIAAGAWAWSRRSATEAGPSSATRTLAVLPIENIGRDSTTDYLADGMTGELANALRKMPGLKVAGDLSTFRFKHSRLAPGEIARQLGVGMLLTGKIQPGRDRIRLQMQLSDLEGNLLWSNTYDRDSKDNFAVQDAITNAVATELRLVLVPTVITVTRAGRTTSPEAHDLFFRGEFEKNKLSEEGLRLSIQYFKRALALDTNYAQAYAGMAFAYDMLADAYAPSHEYHRLAKMAAQEAVRADSMLAEARVIKGFEIAAADWDFPAGEAEMRRGMALDPNSPDGLFMYGVFLNLTGRAGDARVLADRLLQIDRLSPLASLFRSQTLLWSERYAEALDQDRATRRLDADIDYVDPISGTALRELGRYEESIAAYERYQKLVGAPAFGLAMTYARMGRRADAMNVIAALEERSRHTWIDPSFMAAAYAAAGDRDRAMRWLERAFAEKAFSLRFLLNWNSLWLRPMEGDPRFQALRRRVLATAFHE